MKLIAQRRDQDCSDNRLLDHIENYLNKEESSHIVFYAQVSKLTKSEMGYIVRVNQYTKKDDCVTNKPVDFVFSGHLSMPEIIKTFKIKELVRKIKRKR